MKRNCVCEGFYIKSSSWYAMTDIAYLQDMYHVALFHSLLSNVLYNGAVK